MRRQRRNLGFDPALFDRSQNGSGPVSGLSEMEHLSNQLAGAAICKIAPRSDLLGLQASRHPISTSCWREVGSLVRAARSPSLGTLSSLARCSTCAMNSSGARDLATTPDAPIRRNPGQVEQLG